MGKEREREWESGPTAVSGRMRLVILVVSELAPVERQERGPSIVLNRNHGFVNTTKACFGEIHGHGLWCLPREALTGVGARSQSMCLF